MSGRAATSRLVASIPSIPGIRTSIRTTSGACCWHEPDRLDPVAGFGDHLQVRGGAENDGEPGAEQRVVVGDQRSGWSWHRKDGAQPEAAGRRRCRARARRRTSQPARRCRPDPDRGGRCARRPGPVSETSTIREPSVRSTTTVAEHGAACLRVLVSASWTMRYVGQVKIARQPQSRDPRVSRTSTPESLNRSTSSGSVASPGGAEPGRPAASVGSARKPASTRSRSARVARPVSLHPLEQRTGHGRVLVQRQPRGAGLDDEQVDGVPHDVVQLAGHPDAFLGDHLPFERMPGPLLLVAPPGGAVPEPPDHQPDQQDRDQVGRDRCAAGRACRRRSRPPRDDDQRSPARPGRGGVLAHGVRATRVASGLSTVATCRKDSATSAPRRPPGRVKREPDAVATRQPPGPASGRRAAPAEAPDAGSRRASTATTRTKDARRARHRRSAGEATQTGAADGLALDAHRTLAGGSPGHRSGHGTRTARSVASRPARITGLVPARRSAGEPEREEQVRHPAQPGDPGVRGLEGEVDQSDRRPARRRSETSTRSITPARIREKLRIIQRRCSP